MTTFTFVFEDIGFWEKIPDYLESWSCIGTGPSETTRPRILLSCSKSQKLRRVMKENSRPSRNFKLVSGLPVESMPKLQISQQCRYFGELSRITVVDQWERKMMILLLNRYGHKPIYKLGIARSERNWDRNLLEVCWVARSIQLFWSCFFMFSSYLRKVGL